VTVPASIMADHDGTSGAPSLSPEVVRYSGSRRMLTWRRTDADGTVARPPHRLLVSLRVLREHVGSE
jgi:hypothetical protein